LLWVGHSRVQRWRFFVLLDALDHQRGRGCRCDLKAGCCASGGTGRTVDDALLAKFPPTIFFTATRDFAMSGSAYSHWKLLSVGVDSELLIFDGLYHGFMTNPDFPEAQAGYKIAAKFFDKHLGK
jgi:acetyl esterase/lipase